MLGTVDATRMSAPLGLWSFDMRKFSIFISFCFGLIAGGAAMFYGRASAIDLVQRSTIKSQAADNARLEQQVNKDSTLATTWFSKYESEHENADKLSAELTKLQGSCKQ